MCYLAGMLRIRICWILSVVAASAVGIALGRAFDGRASSSVAVEKRQIQLAGIERLHELDERVTVLSDPKALQAEWAADAVRLNCGGPVDDGRAAIYASDVRSFASSPDFKVVSYTPTIRDLQIAGEWAFEWGLFDVTYRPSMGSPAEKKNGQVLRVLHRESNGEWKFARVMISSNTD